MIDQVRVCTILLETYAPLVFYHAIGTYRKGHFQEWICLFEPSRKREAFQLDKASPLQLDVLVNAIYLPNSNTADDRLEVPAASERLRSISVVVYVLMHP